MSGTFGLRGGHALRRDRPRADWKVDIKRSPAGQSVSLYTIPATQCGRWDAEIISHGLNRVALPYSINRKVLRVCLHVAGRVLARSDRDDQLRTGIQISGGVELVGVCDC